MRIFFQKKMDNFWTNYHVILPYIDAFDTYIVTCAWNTKPCTSHSIFILLPWNLQKLISQHNLHLNSTSCIFVQSRSTLGRTDTYRARLVAGHMDSGECRPPGWQSLSSIIARTCDVYHYNRTTFPVNVPDLLRSRCDNAYAFPATRTWTRP